MSTACYITLFLYPSNPHDYLLARLSQGSLSQTVPLTDRVGSLLKRQKKRHPQEDCEGSLRGSLLQRAPIFKGLPGGSLLLTYSMIRPAMWAGVTPTYITTARWVPLPLCSSRLVLNKHVPLYKYIYIIKRVRPHGRTPGKLNQLSFLDPLSCCTLSCFLCPCRHRPQDVVPPRV